MPGFLSNVQFMVFLEWNILSVLITKKWHEIKITRFDNYSGVSNLLLVQIPYQTD